MPFANRDMSKYANRLQTFFPKGKESSLPFWNPLNFDLADAGFHFVQEGDRVTDAVSCFECNLTLSDWYKRGNPLDEHWEHNSSCPFMQKNFCEQLYKKKVYKQKPNDDYSHEVGILQPSKLDFVTMDWKQIEYHTKQIAKLSVLDMALCANRLATFEYFPRQIYPTAEALSAGGFIYSGIGDICVCYSCKLVINMLRRNDDIKELHHHNRPTCEYMKCRGPFDK